MRRLILLPRSLGHRMGHRDWEPSADSPGRVLFHWNAYPSGVRQVGASLTLRLSVASTPAVGCAAVVSPTCRVNGRT